MLNNKTNLVFFFGILEIVSSTLFLHFEKYQYATYINFPSSIFLCIYVLKNPDSKIIYLDSKWIKYFYWLLLSIISVVLIVNGYKLFGKVPIDAKIADMLPVINYLSKRFAEQDFPIYRPIEELWGGFQPKYLPALWLPFVPAQLFDYDLRWTNIAMIILGLSLFYFKKQKFTIYHSILPILTFLLIWYISKAYPQDIYNKQSGARLITITQEGVIIGFYLLLAFTFYKKNYWLQGAAIALCLMSRYSLAFWVPFYLIYVFIENKKEFLKIISSIGIMILGLLLISGAYKELAVFAKMQDNYLNMILNPKNEENFSWTINRSLGLAKFVPYYSLKYLHYSLLVFQIIIPAVFFFITIKFKEKLNINTLLVPILSLKLSLIFFYNFLPISYLYLFFTSTFLTLAILFQYLHFNNPEYEK